MGTNNALSIPTPAWTAGIYGQLEQARPVAELLAKSEMVPKGFQGKPNEILIAGAMGARLGLDLFSALASIAVVNGRATLWGDGMLAICQNHPEWEGMQIDRTGDGDQFAVSVTVSRKGQPPTSCQFSMADATYAGLLGGKGRDASPTWRAYPKRMVENRAKAFALRTAFADALAGFHAREEMDDEPVDVTSSAVVHKDPPPARIRESPPIETKQNPAAVDPAPVETGTATGAAHAAGSVDPAAGGNPVDPPKKDTSVAKCLAEFKELWQKSDSGKASAKVIQASWKLAKIEELTGASDDDREAFLVEVREALAKLEG